MQTLGRCGPSPGRRQGMRTDCVIPRPWLCCIIRPHLFLPVSGWPCHERCLCPRRAVTKVLFLQAVLRKCEDRVPA